MELWGDLPPGIAGAAQILLGQIAASREIAVEGITRAMLQGLVAGAVLREADKRFFLFRPEAVAPKVILMGGAAMPVKLLHVGPAMPTALETEMAEGPVMPEQMGPGLATTVITGVIDDVMGGA